MLMTPVSVLVFGFWFLVFVFVVEERTIIVGNMDNVNHWPWLCDGWFKRELEQNKKKKQSMHGRKDARKEL